MTTPRNDDAAQRRAIRRPNRQLTKFAGTVLVPATFAANAQGTASFAGTVLVQTRGLYRQLAPQRPDALLPDLAMSLGAKGRPCGRSGTRPGRPPRSGRGSSA